MVERQLPKLHTGVRFPSPAGLSMKRQGKSSYVVYGFGPFFSIQGLTKVHPGDWYLGWLGTRIFYGTIGHVVIDMLALEIIFLGVLAAVVVTFAGGARKG